MEDLSLHVLDIAENSVRAGASEIRIAFEENPGSGSLRLSIKDNGKGMDREYLEKVSDPFFTTKKGKEFGLGVSLLKQAAEETGGWFRADSAPGEGTEFTAVFKTDHPDMKPVGDVSLTVKMLKLSHPDIKFHYEYTKLSG